MKKFGFAAAALLASTVAAPAFAGPIINADFESGFGPFSATGNVARANGSTYASCCGTSPSYTNFFAAFGGGNEPSGFISSAFSTLAGRTYTVAFDYGALGTGSEGLTFSVGGTDYVVNPVANNDLFSAFTSTSFSFVGNGLPVSLSITSAGLNNVDAILDNVSVSLSAVPEPATWALMILGFGATGFAMRRRTRTTVAYA